MSYVGTISDLTNFKFTVLDEEDSPTLETQLKKLTEENQKLEETVTGLMKTIEDMTTQIRKMDATAKSNTKLISKLKKKLGNMTMLYMSHIKVYYDNIL